jgi:D-serine dehydratase
MLIKLYFFNNVVIFFVEPTFSLQKPGMLHSVYWQLVTGVLGRLISPIFKGKAQTGCTKTPVTN